MLEGVKLALFTSASEDDDEDENDCDGGNDGSHYSNSTMNRTTTATGTDISPSTDNARRRGGTNNIDRMILTGESTMMYAWTPEEATSMRTL
jgi:hypothetical protein